MTTAASNNMLARHLLPIIQAVPHGGANVWQEALALLGQYYHFDGARVVQLGRKGYQVTFGSPAMPEVMAILKRLDERMAADVDLPPGEHLERYYDEVFTINLVFREDEVPSVGLSIWWLQPPSDMILSSIQQDLRLLWSIAQLADDLAIARQRVERLSLMFQTGQAMASSLDLKEVLGQTIEVATAMLDGEAGTLFLVDWERRELVFELPVGTEEGTLKRRRMPMNSGIAGWVVSHEEPQIVNDVSTDTRFNVNLDTATGFITRSILCVPIKVKGRLIGVLEVLNKADDQFTDEEAEWLSTIANQAGIAIENARLYASLAEERDRIISAQEEVRHDLNRALHDGPAQYLATMIFNIDMVRKQLASNPAAARVELDLLEDLARKANQEIRQQLFELRPLVLETRGLLEAIRYYGRQLHAQHSLQVHLNLPKAVPIRRKEGASVIFAILQEAMNNVAKHAQARHLWVTMQVVSSELIGIVADDGRGFDVQQVLDTIDERASFGVLNMLERSRLIDGRLNILSPRPGAKAGTEVTLRVPLERLR